MDKFKIYLDERNISPRQFALYARIAERTAYNAYRGRPIIRRTAKSIVRATKGILKLDDLNISSPNDPYYDTGNSCPMDTVAGD